MRCGVLPRPVVECLAVDRVPGAPGRRGWPRWATPWVLPAPGQGRKPWFREFQQQGRSPRSRLWIRASTGLPGATRGEAGWGERKARSWSRRVRPFHAPYCDRNRDRKASHFCRAKRLSVAGGEARHSRIDPSWSTEASVPPSGLNATPLTRLLWPVRQSISWPLAVSQIRTDWSWPAVARDKPSAEKATW